MGKVLKVLAVVVAIAVIVFAPQLIPQILGATLIATAVTAAVVIGATIALNTLLAPRPSTQVPPPGVFRQAISNSFIVYGKRRVGGLLVFFHSKKHTDGKHYRYFVIAVAGHRCQGVVSWMLNDDIVTVDGSGVVTSGPYATACQFWFDRGEDDATANATFVSECGGKWTANHRGRGVAKIFAKFRMNDAVIEAGMPNMTAVIEGKDDVLDPRDATEKYTDNAALVFYDFMRNPREEGYFGAYDDEIPDDTWISAQANVCDEDVEGEPRYALDGIIATGAAPSEVRDTLIVNCAGSYTFSEGVHLLRVGYWVPPTQTLNEDQLAGAITVSPFMPSDVAANEIQGTFYDPTENYQPTPFSTKTADPSPEDIRQQDLDLAFITSRHRGERIATIMLNRAACEKTVVWPMNIEGLKVGAMDVVGLDTARYALSNYAWVVKGWSLTADFSITLSLREENEDIYGEPSVTTPSVIDTIDVPDPLLSDSELQQLIRAVYARGLTLTGVDNGDVTGRIEISDHFHDWPGIGGVAITGVADLTGLTLEETYYVYCDLDEVGDTSPTFGATLNYSTALNSSVNPNRMYLNQLIILPGVGDPPTTGGGSGGGYGGGDVPPGVPE